MTMSAVSTPQHDEQGGSVLFLALAERQGDSDQPIKQPELSVAHEAQEFEASRQPSTKGRVGRVAGRVYLDIRFRLTTAADLKWAHMRLLQCREGAFGAQAKHQRVASHATAHATIDHEAVGTHHRPTDDPFRGCGESLADSFHGASVVGH